MFPFSARGEHGGGGSRNWKFETGEWKEDSRGDAGIAEGGAETGNRKLETGDRNTCQRALAGNQATGRLTESKRS